MSSVSLVLVLSSAFLHSLWNALLKRQEDPEAGVVGVTAVAVLAGGVWTLGLKGQAFPTGAGLAWGLAAGLFEGVYLATLARSVRQAPLGLVYTVARGGALLLVWPVSVLWLGEGLTPWAAAGAVLTLRNTSIAFALALSALQGERLARKQWMGAALVLGGAVLLGWPA